MYTELKYASEHVFIVTLMSVHISISKHNLSDRAVNQFPRQHCAMCVSAPNILPYSMQPQKVKIAFLVWLIFFTASTAGWERCTKILAGLRGLNSPHHGPTQESRVEYD